MVVDYNDIDEYVSVANSYTYTPFGQFYGTPDETVDNPFKFTGQWYDAEIAQYYLRARQYDPTMMRFTSQDPVRGDRQEPLTLHRYLYCVNDPIDRVDPSGEFAIGGTALRVTNAVLTAGSLYGHGLSLAAYSVDTGDDRFWQLAEATFKFMPFAAAIAAGNPLGPLANMATSATIHINQMAYGSTTGMSTAQGLAVDPLAFLAYRIRMGRAIGKIGANANDMENFMSWMGADWVERVNDIEY